MKPSTLPFKDLVNPQDFSHIRAPVKNTPPNPHPTPAELRAMHEAARARTYPEGRPYPLPNIDEDTWPFKPDHTLNNKAGASVVTYWKDKSEIHVSDPQLTLKFVAEAAGKPVKVEAWTATGEKIGDIQPKDTDRLTIRGGAAGTRLDFTELRGGAKVGVEMQTPSSVRTGKETRGLTLTYDSNQNERLQTRVNHIELPLDAEWSVKPSQEKWDGPSFKDKAGNQILVRGEKMPFAVTVSGTDRHGRTHNASFDLMTLGDTPRLRTDQGVVSSDTFIMKEDRTKDSLALLNDAQKKTQGAVDEANRQTNVPPLAPRPAPKNR